MNDKKCPQCKYLLPQSANFCRMCGASQIKIDKVSNSGVAINSVGINLQYNELKNEVTENKIEKKTIKEKQKFSAQQTKMEAQIDLVTNELSIKSVILGLAAGLILAGFIFILFFKPQVPNSVMSVQSPAPEGETAHTTTSDSIEFSDAKLSSKIKEYSDGNPLEIDGNKYYFSKSRALLISKSDNIEPLDQLIISIEFQCVDSIFGKSKGNASIENISCKTDPISLEKYKWQKLCNLHSFTSAQEPLDFIYLKNNAFVTVRRDDNKKSFIETLGIDLNKGDYDQIYKKCEEVEELKKIALQKGFKSLGDMMVEQ
jgi:hypothetical protein